MHHHQQSQLLEFLLIDRYRSLLSEFVKFFDYVPHVLISEPYTQIFNKHTPRASLLDCEPPLIPSIPHIIQVGRSHGDLLLLGNLVQGKYSFASPRPPPRVFSFEQWDLELWCRIVQVVSVSRNSRPPFPYILPHCVRIKLKL